MRAIIAATGLLALTACGGPQPIDMSRLDQVINTTRALCRQGQPLLAAAALIPEPRVVEIATAVNNVCGMLAAGTVPTTLDANTPAMLATNLGALAKLMAQAAQR